MFTVQIASAQQIDWEWQYDEPEPHSPWVDYKAAQGRHLAPTADSGWIVSAEGGYFSSVLLRADARGHLRWIRKAGSPDTSTVLVMRLSRELPDGNVEFIGGTSFYPPQSSPVAGPMYRAVYRNSGGELDSVHVSVPDSTPYNYYGLEAGSCITILPDGGVMQVELVKYGNDLMRGGLRFTRANVAGARMQIDTGDWVQYPGGGGDTMLFPKAIFAMQDGGYLVVGDVAWLGTGGRPFLLRTDSHCRQRWRRELSPPGSDGATQGAALTVDGGVILCGMAKVRDSLSGAIKVWPRLIKTDSSGIKEWDHFYPLSDNAQAIAVAPIPTTGGYVFGGYAVRPTTASDHLVVGVDSDGMMQWQSVWGGAGNDDVWALAAMPDGGAVVTGFREDSTLGQTNRNRRLYLARIVPSLVSVEQEARGTSHLAVSPLPARGHLDVEVIGEGAGTIALIDILGRTVQRIELEEVRGERRVVFDVENLTPGSYVLEAMLGGVRSTVRVDVVR